LDLSATRINDIGYLYDYIKDSCPWASKNRLQIDIRDNNIDSSNFRNHDAIKKLSALGVEVLLDTDISFPSDKQPSLKDKLISLGIPERAIDLNQELLNYIGSIERNDIISSNRNFFVNDMRGQRWMLKFTTDKRRATMEAFVNYHLSGTFKFIPPSDMEEPLESNGVYITKQKDLRGSIIIPKMVYDWLDCFADYHNRAASIFEENMIELPDAFIRSTEEELERYAQGRKISGFSIDSIKFNEAISFLEGSSDKAFIHNDAKTGNFYGDFIVDWELAGLGDPAIDIAMVLMNYNVPKDGYDHYLDHYIRQRGITVSLDSDLNSFKERIDSAIYFVAAREVIGSSRRPMTEEIRRNNERLIANYLCRPA